MITPDELLTSLTYEEAKKVVYDGVAAVGVDTTGWKPGFVVRTLIAVLAVVVVVFSELATLIGKSAFLDFATGDWLTFLARYVYGTERELATFAAGVVTLDNSAGGGLYIWAPLELVISNPDTDKLYRNTSAITLNPGQVLTGVPFVAVEAGSDSTSTAGTIVTFETPFDGLVCTNPAIFLGTDDEEDESLRARAREVLGARSANGPQDAYAAAARRAKLADGTPIGVNRIRTRNDGRGNVYIYVATPSGEVVGTLADETSPLGRVNLEIQRTAAPLAVTARVASGVPVTINLTGTLYSTDKQGFSDADISAKVAQAAALYFAGTPIGGYVIDAGAGYVYAVDIAAKCKVLTTIFRVALDTPDTVIAVNAFPVLGAVSVATSVQPQATL